MPPDGPSTSGRSELSEEVERLEPDIPHRGPCRTPSESVLHNDERFYDNIIPPGLWQEKNGRFQSLDGVVISVIAVCGLMIGIADDGYIRPIYNENHKMVVIREKDKIVREITPEQAERLHINQPMPNRRRVPNVPIGPNVHNEPNVHNGPNVHNVPNEPNMSAGPSRPSGDRKGRRKNKQRNN